MSEKRAHAVEIAAAWRRELGRQMTEAQVAALAWLGAHGGAGVFDYRGVLIASGEAGPHKRATWDRLCALGVAEVYYGKLRLRRPPGLGDGA